MDTKPIRELIKQANLRLQACPNNYEALQAAIAAAERALTDHERLYEAINSVPSGLPALEVGELEALRLADDLSESILSATIEFQRAHITSWMERQVRAYRKTRGLE